MLRRLETIARRYGGSSSAEKRRLLRQLAKSELGRADQLLRLHELACFLRAYPDDAAVLSAAERLLARFERRRDLTRHRERLADSGIAGTPIHFAFHWVTARWLARQCPARLRVDWDALDDPRRLFALLPLLLPYVEAPDLEQHAWSAAEWVTRLKGPGETDAEFLIRRFEALEAEPRLREAWFHSLALPMRLEPAAGNPSRTHALLKIESAPVFQTEPLQAPRPDLRAAIGRPPLSVRSLLRRDAEGVIDLAREAMLTRGRDLDGIMYASADDVRLIDCGDGMRMACIGLLPEQRALVETIYVFLLFKNRVPIGYFQAALLFGSAELNYHVFPSFRGGESAPLYARALAVVHHLFASDTFAVHPYQLGHENPDARGAFWFYAKLGFVPADPRIARLQRRELARIRKQPSYRSPVRVLDQLARGYVHFELGAPRDDVAGKLPLGAFPLAISAYLARRFGAEREAGIRVCAAEAQRLLGVELADWSPPERLWWERWAPLVLALPGVARWGDLDRRALAQVVRAKGARREQDFARRLDQHAPLRRALIELAASAELRGDQAGGGRLTART
jgi:hypothetical protein